MKNQVIGYLISIFVLYHNFSQYGDFGNGWKIIVGIFLVLLFIIYYLNTEGKLKEYSSLDTIKINGILSGIFLFFYILPVIIVSNSFGLGQYGNSTFIAIILTFLIICVFWVFFFAVVYKHIKKKM